MNNIYTKNIPFEYDEFAPSGLYLVNQTISSLQEVILVYLKELAYYLLKLKDLGANNEQIKECIIEAISGIVTNVDYNNEEFKKLLAHLAIYLNQAKTLYSTLCKKNGIETKYLKTPFKYPKSFNIVDIIKRGEKYYIKKNASISAEQKNLFDIIVLLIKRIAIKIQQIKSYKKDYDSAYNAILVLLNSMNDSNASIAEVKSTIETCTLEHQNLLTNLYLAQEESHGKREAVHIPFTPRTGKAILVSGIDMTQLEAVLKATKDRHVDVYTHGTTMLMAHTLANFRKYPNLVGHYGRGTNNSLFDFAAFPGSVLMTRYLFQKIEYLYRGRLFTTDSFAPKGIVKLHNNFEPLIQAALNAKGFTKAQQQVILHVGFKQKSLDENIKAISEKAKKKEIKRLYIIGLMPNNNLHKSYFDKFLKLMPKDSYALSLSYERNEENILHIDSFYDYLLIYKVLEKIIELNLLNEIDITIFITQCDQYSITNIMNFINMGIKNIYMCKCLPSLINPNMMETLKKTFGVKEFSTPEQDLEATLV